VRRHSRHPLRASALCGSDLFRRESSWELAPPHTGADSERDACLAPAELADDNKMEKSAGLCRDERSLVIQALRTTSVEVLPEGALGVQGFCYLAQDVTALALSYVITACGARQVWERSRVLG